MHEQEIPDIFKSYLSGRKFEICLNCEKELLKEGTHYMIEKAFYNGQLEFEHAICFDCAQEMRSYMSEESLKNISLFMAENFNETERMMRLFEQSPEPDVNLWLEKCAITGSKIEELQEYQIYAHCHADKIVYSALPFVVSGKIIEKMSEKLSKVTKDELDRYMNKHFNIPPEWMEIIKNKKVIF
ncbi:MAG: hypothetical protein Kow0068_07480 [Marinilabiliales bacterium]